MLSCGFNKEKKGLLTVNVAQGLNYIIAIISMSKSVEIHYLSILAPLA